MRYHTLRIVPILAVTLCLLCGCEYLRQPINPTISRSLGDAQQIVDNSPTNLDAILNGAITLARGYGGGAVGLVGLLGMVWKWREANRLKTDQSIGKA